MEIHLIFVRRFIHTYIYIYIVYNWWRRDGRRGEWRYGMKIFFYNESIMQSGIYINTGDVEFQLRDVFEINSIV